MKVARFFGSKNILVSDILVTNEREVAFHDQNDPFKPVESEIIVPGGWQSAPPGLVQISDIDVVKNNGTYSLVPVTNRGLDTRWLVIIDVRNIVTGFLVKEHRDVYITSAVKNEGVYLAPQVNTLFFATLTFNSRLKGTVATNQVGVFVLEPGQVLRIEREGCRDFYISVDEHSKVLEYGEYSKVFATSYSNRELII